MSGLAGFFHHLKLPKKTTNTNYDDIISTPPPKENHQTGRRKSDANHEKGNNNAGENAAAVTDAGAVTGAGADADADGYNVSLRDIDEYCNTNGGAEIDANNLNGSHSCSRYGNTYTHYNQKTYKSTHREWKEYCYRDIFNYVYTREDMDDNVKDRGDEYSYDKMIGKYYYDSENEQNNDDDDDDERVHFEGGCTNNSVDSLSPEFGQEQYQQQAHSHEQLETQPIGSLLNNSQENNTIQEFTPSPPADETDQTNNDNAVAAVTDVKTTLSTTDATTATTRITLHQTQETTLHQSLESNSSFYSPAGCNKDGRHLALSRQETTKTSNTKSSQNATLTASATRSKTKSKSNNYKGNDNDNNEGRNSKKKMLTVPKICQTTSIISRISEINLQTTQSLSIPLSSVNMFWGHKRLKRIPKDFPEMQSKIDQAVATVETVAMIETDSRLANKTGLHEITSEIHQYEYHSLERLINKNVERMMPIHGPLFQNYKHGCYLELLELDEDYLNLDYSVIHGSSNEGGNNSNHDKGSSARQLTDAERERNQRIHESAKAVFSPAVDLNSTNNNKSNVGVSNKNKPRRRRIRVFFYNDYAVQVTKIIQKIVMQQKKIIKDTNCQVDAVGTRSDNDITVERKEITKSDYPFLVSLYNVPARCIFPYHLGRSDRAGEALLENNYYERLAPYCICIGGNGRMKFSGDREITFDSDDIEIRFLSLNDTKEEFIVKKDTVVLDLDPLPPNMKSGMKERLTNLINLHKRQKEIVLKKKQEEQRISGGDANHDNMGATSDLQPSHSITEASRTDNSPISPSSRKRKRVSIQNHVYRKLDEVKEHLENTKGKKPKEREVDVYGIVLSLGVPTLTKKGDWMLHITLTDDSIAVSNDETVTTNALGEGRKTPNTFTMIFFNRSINSLPKILCAGDILRCHRVIPEQYNGALQLTSLNWSTFTTIRPKSRAAADALSLVDNWDVQGYQKTPIVISRVEELWEYGQDLLSNYPMVDPNFRLTIDNILPFDNNNSLSEKKFGDITLMVANIIPFPASQQTELTPKGFLRGWDGTGPPDSDPLPFGVETIAEDEPSSETVASIARIVDQINRNSNNNSYSNSETLSRVDPPQSLCGRVINVVIWEANHWNLIQNAGDYVSIGKFIRLRNIKEGNLYSQDRNKPGPRCLQVHSTTLLTPLPDHAFDVANLIRNHNQRVLQGIPYNPQSGILPLNKRLSRDLLSDHNSFKLLPQCLHNQYPIVNGVRSWYSLIECITDEAPNSSIYPVQFQVVKAWSIPSKSKECSNKSQVVLEIQDRTAKISVIIPHEEEPSNIVEFVLKTGVFRSSIRSFENNGKKYFALEGKLLPLIENCSI